MAKAGASHETPNRKLPQGGSGMSPPLESVVLRQDPPGVDDLAWELFRSFATLPGANSRKAVHWLEQAYDLAEQFVAYRDARST